MKKLHLLIILLLLGFKTMGQSTMTPEQTLELFDETNEMYCKVIGDMINCMFEYDESKFDSALENLKIIRKNYDQIYKFGVFSGSDAARSMARERFGANYWELQNLSFDRELFKSEERKKKVEYHNFDYKISKKLKGQFKKLLEIEDRNCNLLYNLF